ncbi:MAG: hypothetical protein COB53_04085 [Elusimicrobia bacterium]|nr:MAG: hypothetical protein COB53_04085 [Elusimicrobiota bacterium]
MADNSKEEFGGESKSSVEDEIAALERDLGKEIGSLWKDASTPQSLEVEQALKAKKRELADLKTEIARRELEALKAQVAQQQGVLDERAALESKIREEERERFEERAQFEARIRAEEQGKVEDRLRAEKAAEKRAALEQQMKAEFEIKAAAEAAAEAKRIADAALLARAAAEAKRMAELDARRHSELEITQKAEQDAKRRAQETEEKARALVEEAEQMRAKAALESEALRRAADLHILEDAKRRIAEEAQAQAAMEAQRITDDAATAYLEAEAKNKAETEHKANADAEKKRKAEVKLKAQAEAQAKWHAQQEAIARANAEAKRKAQQAAKEKAEVQAAAKRQDEQEAKEKAEADRKAEIEATRVEEAEATRTALEFEKAKADKIAAKAKAIADAKAKAAEVAVAKAKSGLAEKSAGLETADLGKIREELKQHAEDTGRAEDLRHETKKESTGSTGTVEKEESNIHEKKTGDAYLHKRSRSWLYEMPLFYILLISLQRALLADDPMFLSVQPSPLWIGIWLFGLRYGLAAGLITGMTAAGLHCWGIQMIGDSYRFEDMDFYIRPGLFIVMGVALGIVADNAWDRITGLRTRVLELLERISGLQKHVQAEQKVLRAVEQQVVGQMSSIVTLFHGSKELSSLDRKELLPAMHTFFTQAIRATKSSLYVPHEGKWILFKEIGWGKADTYRKVEEVGGGLVGRAGAERRTVSVRDTLLNVGSDGVRRDLKSDALMAAPIMDPSGKAIAVFAVQAMEFMRFNSSSVNLMTLLAEWGADSVAKCDAVEDLKARSLFDEDFEVHSVRYFMDEAGQQFDRSLRYSLPFSVMLVSAPGAEAMPENKRLSFLRMLSRIMREAVRSVDIVCRTSEEGAIFGVLMSTTTKEDGQLARERISAQIDAMDLPVKVRLGVGSYGPNMTKLEELFAQAKSQLI